MKTLLLLLTSAALLVAADVTGTWTGTLTPEGAPQGFPAHIILKQEGTKLTGTAGPDAGEQVPLTGTIEGANVTFEAAMGPVAMKFALKVEGDEMKGDVSREREGQKQSAKVAVKRQK